MSFLNSIKNNSSKHEIPFDHWEYSDALSEGSIEEIIKADIPDLSKLNLSYDGTRAIDGGSAEIIKSSKSDSISSGALLLLKMLLILPLKNKYNDKNKQNNISSKLSVYSRIMF